MKPQFWIFTVLVLVGAVLVGYQSGRSNGARATRLETRQFLRDFARSTELEAYFQQRGQPQRILELTAYDGAPGSRSRGPSVLVGFICIAAGVFGLLPRSKGYCADPGV